MSNIAAFGSYVPGQSAVHRMNAQVKIILACVFSVAVFFVDTWPCLIFFSGLCTSLYSYAGISMRKAFSGLTGIAFILVFTVLSQTICVSVLDGLACWLSLEGFERGLFYALRIALIFEACGLLTFTTSTLALVVGLQKLLTPFRWVKLPVDDICMVVSMALRFVPTVTQEAHAIRKAQISRGAAFEDASLWRRLISWKTVFVPLLVRLFKRSEVLGQAMDARCYTGKNRGSLYEFSFTPDDGAILFLGIFFICLLAVVA